MDKELISVMSAAELTRLATRLWDTAEELYETICFACDILENYTDDGDWAATPKDLFGADRVAIIDAASNALEVLSLKLKEAAEEADKPR